MIMEMVGNHDITLITRNGKRSRLPRLKNGVPQGSVLAPLLFNISDLPTTVPRKYACADNLATMHADGDWQAVEGVLSKDIATVSECFQTWKLKLSATKIVSAVFHLNNKEAKCELKVSHNGKTMPFCSEPKYLGVTLDWTLRIVDTLIHFATRWHHASHSWGGLLAGTLEQQRSEHPP